MENNKKKKNRQRIWRALFTESDWDISGTLSCDAPFLFEGWNRVISRYINSERQIKLNNYTETDNNQQNSWLKTVKDSGLLVLSWHDNLVCCYSTQPERKITNTFQDSAKAKRPSALTRNAQGDGVLWALVSSDAGKCHERAIRLSCMFP